MPELSRFFGIVVRMYFDDHPPPHFHASYGDASVVVRIETLTAIAGSLPPRAMGLVVEWAALRQQELREAWGRASRYEAPGTIAPLE